MFKTLEMEIILPNHSESYQFLWIKWEIMPQVCLKQGSECCWKKNKNQLKAFLKIFINDNNDNELYLFDKKTYIKISYIFHISIKINCYYGSNFNFNINLV